MASEHSMGMASEHPTGTAGEPPRETRAMQAQMNGGGQLYMQTNAFQN